MSDPLVGSLIRWRLHWWGVATGRVVVRHWQWFVLAGVLVPAGAPLRGLLLALASPLLQAVQVGHGVGWHFTRIGAIELVAAAWVLVQRHAIAGGDFLPYVRALPLTAAQRRIVDLAVLVPANTLLLVPVAATLLLAPVLGFFTGGLMPAAIPVLAVLALLVQLVVLEGRALAAVPILAADLALSWALSGVSAIAQWSALSAAFVLGLSALVPTPRIPLPVADRAQRRMAAAERLLGPTWRIQCKALAARAATLMRTLALSAIALAANILYAAFAFDDRALPTAALMLAALALVTAGWYRTLHDAHAPVSDFLSTLPLSRHFWRWRDIRFIAVLGALPASAVLGPLLVRAPHRLPAVALLLLGYWALLAALRWPLLRGGRQATLLAAMMAGAWSAAAVAATH